MILDKFIISHEMPSSTTAGWIKPIGNGKYSILLYGANGWTSITDSNLIKDIYDNNGTSLETLLSDINGKIEDLQGEISGGGSGGGIENIEAEGDSPLNLEVTISGTLATITGSVDVASDTSYGMVKCGLYEFDTAWDTEPFTSFAAQEFNNLWGGSTIDGGPSGHDSPQLFYKVYQPDIKSGIAKDESLMVGIPYPAPENILTTDDINDVKYVLCVTSRGYLRRVPVSLFIQE